MLTLVPGAHTVHQGAPDAAASGGHGVYVVVVFLVVLLLMAALKNLRRATAPIGELIRVLVAALAVGALLLAAIALLVVTLFLGR